MAITMQWIFKSTFSLRKQPSFGDATNGFPAKGRGHFEARPVVTSRNIGCFLRLVNLFKFADRIPLNGQCQNLR